MIQFLIVDNQESIVHLFGVVHNRQVNITINNDNFFCCSLYDVLEKGVSIKDLPLEEYTPSFALWGEASN